MTNLRIAFEKLDGVTPEQILTGKIKLGYNYCSTNMLFDIKMDGNFTRKDHLVANGHKTNAPGSITYPSVVSTDIYRIVFIIVSLNNLDICACEIGNYYLNTNYRENLYMVAGTEFVPLYRDIVMVIDRDLYGLKSIRVAWREKIMETLNSMGYCYTESDPYVWFKQAVKPSCVEC